VQTSDSGDVIEGKRVFTALDMNVLEPGRKHRLYFRGMVTSTGQDSHVSVTVAMSGTVMAVTDVYRPALESMQHRWPNSGRGIDLVDMNREWPGDENGPTAASRLAGLLFNRLLRPNADYAIDIHTGTTPFGVTAFNMGERRVPAVRAVPELYPVGQVFDNPVYPEVLHNAFMDVGIPCFTPEIAVARILDPAKIALFVEGMMNVLKHHGILAGPMGRTAKDVRVFVCNSAFAIPGDRRGDRGAAQRRHGRARKPPRFHPVQPARPEGTFGNLQVIPSAVSAKGRARIRAFISQVTKEPRQCRSSPISQQYGSISERLPGSPKTSRHVA
jgi:hypothetical protein